MDDFIKTLKGGHITFMPELPPEGIKAEIGAGILVPSENPSQLNLYIPHKTLHLYGVGSINKKCLTCK